VAVETRQMEIDWVGGFVAMPSKCDGVGPQFPAQEFLVQGRSRGRQPCRHQSPPGRKRDKAWSETQYHGITHFISDQRHHPSQSTAK